MANECSYDIRARGKKEDIEKLIEIANTDEGRRLGRVYGADVTVEGEEVWISGDCAWSIKSSMLTPDNPTNLQRLSKDLNLLIEAYSEEPGIGFMEHYAWDCGEVLCEECEDYIQWWVDDLEYAIYLGNIDDSFWKNNLVLQAGMNEENYKDFANCEGEIRLGGFEYTWEFTNKD